MNQINVIVITNNQLKNYFEAQMLNTKVHNTLVYSIPKSENSTVVELINTDEHTPLVSLATPPRINNIIALTDYIHSVNPSITNKNTIIIDVEAPKYFTNTNNKLTWSLIKTNPSRLPLYFGKFSISEQLLKGIISSAVSFYNPKNNNILLQEALEININDFPVDILGKYAQIVLDVIGNSDRPSDLFKSINSIDNQIKDSGKDASGRNNFISCKSYSKQDAVIDFNAHVLHAHNQIRSFSYPFFISHFNINQLIINKNRISLTQNELTTKLSKYIFRDLLFIERSTIEQWSGAIETPGTILDISTSSIEVACAEGSINLILRTQLQ